MLFVNLDAAFVIVVGEFATSLFPIVTELPPRVSVSKFPSLSPSTNPVDPPELFVSDNSATSPIVFPSYTFVPLISNGL